MLLARCASIVLDALPCQPPRMTTTTADLLKLKVGALCDYLDSEYQGGIETATLREMPVQVVAALIVEHLLPMKQLLESCEDMRDLLNEQEHGAFFFALAALAGKDARAKRFLLFFCDLLDD